MYYYIYVASQAIVYQHLHCYRPSYSACVQYIFNFVAVQLVKLVYNEATCVWLFQPT